MNNSFIQSEGATIDKEHTVQIQLINLLAKAVIDNKGDSEKAEILDQLISFTQVHFMSEGLVMRQHSFEDYDEHNHEHDAMIDHLNKLKKKVQSGSTSLDLQKLNELRSMLLNHIGNQDQRFSAYLAALAT